MAKAFVNDGDVGSGRPGSPQWHRVQVAQMSNLEILNHLRDSFGVCLVCTIHALVPFLTQALNNFGGEDFTAEEVIEDLEIGADGYLEAIFGMTIQDVAGLVISQHVFEDHSNGHSP